MRGGDSRAGRALVLVRKFFPVLFLYKITKILIFLKITLLIKFYFLFFFLLHPARDTCLRVGVDHVA
jgi:hypothetical protein